jgi:peptide/nickel transport system permease protein
MKDKDERPCALSFILQPLTFLMNRLGKIGILIITIFFFVAIFAPLIAPYDPVTQYQYSSSISTEDRLKPTRDHPLGLDDLGRDVLSRVIYGAQISMQVGILVVSISALTGIIIGAFSGYYGGWIDRFFSGFLFNVFLSFPSILLAIAMVAFLGPSIRNLILALCVIGWVGYARLMRGQVLKVREYDFVTAARALGANDVRIIFRHILPNAIQPLIVQASLGMAGAVLAEASLSFLGLGVQPPQPSWGVMLNDARSYLRVAPHLLIFPGLAVMLTVLAFNFVGDGLRERLDPKQRRS